MSHVESNKYPQYLKELEHLPKSIKRWDKAANFFIGGSLTSMLFVISESNATTSSDLIDKAPFGAALGIAATVGAYTMKGIRFNRLETVNQQIDLIESENLNEITRVDIPEIASLTNLMTGEPTRDSE